MVRDPPPDSASLRIVTEARLQKLSASTHQQPASPVASRVHPSKLALPLSGSSRRSSFSDRGVPAPTVDILRPVGNNMAAAKSGAAVLPALRTGAAHQASDSLGGSSDQASPRFLELLRSSLPRTDEDDSCSGSGATGSTPSGASPQQQQQLGAELPSTLAMLHALNGSAKPGLHTHATGCSPEVGYVATDPAAAAAGKHKKRSFLGLFRSKDKDKHGKQRHRGSPEPADGGSGDSKHGGEARGKKTGSSWFGSSKSSEVSPLASQLPLPTAAGLSAEGHQVSPNGVLLPGLPLAAAAPSTDGGSSVAADEASGGVAAKRNTPDASLSASDMSAPSTAHPSPAVAPLGLPPGAEAAANDKKGHRRHRSLTSMLVPGWRRRRTTSAGSESEVGGDVTPTVGGSSLAPSLMGSPAPRAAEALAAAANNGAAGSYIAEEEPPLPLLPPGTTGLRNIGNTCFVNVALQCLRYTPGLPLQVAPDLLQRAQQQRQAQPAGQRAGAASPELEPAAGEEVHEQAMARASMDMRAPAAYAAANAQAEDEQQQGGQEGGEGDNGAAAGDAEDGSKEVERGEGAGVAPVASDAQAAAGSQPPVSNAAAAAADEGQQPEEQAAGAGDQQQQGASGPADSPQPAAAAAPAAQARPQRPPKGALLQAFADLVTDLYVPPTNGTAAATAVCALPLLKTLRAFPIAADYFDGGQHDCQEMLRVVMDLLHEDLNRAPPRQPAQQQAVPASSTQAAAQSDEAEQSEQQESEQGAQQGAETAPAADASSEHQQQQDHQQHTPSPDQLQQEGNDAAAQQQQQPEGEQQREGSDQQQEGGQQQQERPAEDEAAKAERLWQQYLERDNSVITDLFGGQLQSSVTCHKCGGRFTMYEPFWDLSLPLAKEAKGGSFSWLGLKGSTPASIQDCLTAFTADEKMEGAEAFHCERCRDKTPATKHLRVHRFPDVLVLHIKRFKYKGASTDKLTANVSFPLTGLHLHAYASPECAAAPDECTYDLFAVSNHYGNLSGGHYTAMCRVPQRDGSDAWYSFNDEQVTRVSPSQVVSQYAYILFYVRSRNSAAAAGARHRRTASAASAGAPAASQGQ